MNSQEKKNVMFPVPKDIVIKLIELSANGLECDRCTEVDTTILKCFRCSDRFKVHGCNERDICYKDCICRCCKQQFCNKCALKIHCNGPLISKYWPHGIYQCNGIFGTICNKCVTAYVCRMCGLNFAQCFECTNTPKSKHFCNETFKGWVIGGDRYISESKLKIVHPLKRLDDE